MCTALKEVHGINKPFNTWLEEEVQYIFFGSTLMGEEAKCDFLDVFGLLLCIYCVFFCLCLAYNGIAQSQLKNIQFQSRLSSKGKCLTYHGASSILEYLTCRCF